MSAIPKYCIESELSEKQIEADVATYFGWCSPIGALAPFRLIDIDERDTGADKLFNVGAAIYMQFKKSTGLKRLIGVSARKNKSKLEEIREFRREEGLEDNPSLFFKLREKSKTADDFQHNVLLAHENPPNSRAIYVAPLLLGKAEYSAALFNSGSRFAASPFFVINALRISQRRWASHLGSIPFLREHISIPPHERVDSADHYFAFAPSGVDVSWHSPSILTREPSRLSDFMKIFFSMQLSRAMLPIGDLEGYLRQRAPDEVARHTFEGESPLGRILNYGRWLWETHQIRQFIVLGNAEKLASWYAG